MNELELTKSHFPGVESIIIVGFSKLSQLQIGALLCYYLDFESHVSVSCSMDEARSCSTMFFNNFLLEMLSVSHQSPTDLLGMDWDESVLRCLKAEDMIRKGLRPDKVTFLCVKRCSHPGWWQKDDR